MFADADSGKWGTDIEGKIIVSPEELFIRRKEYDKVIIASMYYKEIKEYLDNLGFTEEDYIVYE